MSQTLNDEAFLYEVVKKIKLFKIFLKYQDAF